MRQSRSICGVLLVVEEVDEDVAEKSLAMSTRRPAAIVACCGEAVTWSVKYGGFGWMSVRREKRGAMKMGSWRKARERGRLQTYP